MQQLKITITLSLCVKFHNTLKFMVICKCCKVVGSYKILNGIFNLQNCKKKNCFVNVNLMDTFKFNSILHTQPTKILREFFFSKNGVPHKSNSQT